jgi:AcrR family transcriptional regulator
MPAVHSKPLPEAERRAETVRAVIDLAAVGDPAQITTAAIAKQMGLTQGSIFRHFVNKDAIAKAVVDWISDLMARGTARHVEQAVSPTAALKAIFFGHVEFVAAHPGVPRILMSEMQKAGNSTAKKLVLKLMERYRKDLADLIAQGQAQGVLDSDMEPTVAAQVFMGVIHGLVVQTMLTKDSKTMLKNAPKAYAIFIRGLGGTDV